MITQSQQMRDEILFLKKHGNRSRPVVIEIDSQGELLKVKLCEPVPRVSKPTVHFRGNVTQFSAKSRKRLLETFARFDRMRVKFASERVKFVTLTYVDNMQDHARAYRDLKVFIERIQERCDDAWIVWRKELQQRGAIHFHLMLGNVKFIPKQDIKNWWAEVVNAAPESGFYPSFEDLQPGQFPFTRIEAIRSLNGVMYYVSKYMGKPEKRYETGQNDHENTPPEHLGLSVCHIFSDDGCSDESEKSGGFKTDCERETQPDESTGRWWGVYGRVNMPFALRNKRFRVISQETWELWTAAAESPYPTLWHGWTLFSEDQGCYLELLDKIVLALVHDNADAQQRWAMMLREFFSLERDAAVDWYYAAPAYRDWILAQVDELRETGGF